MIVLDTNVASELMRPAPSPAVVAAAAICRVNGADLATRNTTDFAETGIVLTNPWGERG